VEENAKKKTKQNMIPIPRESRFWKPISSFGVIPIFVSSLHHDSFMGVLMEVSSSFLETGRAWNDEKSVFYFILITLFGTTSNRPI
jgi:hypothetical protein